MARIKTVKVIKRGKSYQLYYYSPRGERRRLSTGIDYQQAQRLAIKFNEWLLYGKNPEIELKKAQLKEQTKAITLREFYPFFMERHGSLQSKNMQELYHYRFNNIGRCPQLADIPISSISKKNMLDYMNLRMKQDGISSATVNREAAMIKSMLFRAVEWDIIEHNPLQGLKLLPETKKRDVNITMEEASIILSYLNEPMSNIVEFAFYTGFRKESILSLRIEDIRFHDLNNTAEVELLVKGGKREVFLVNSHASKVLKRVIINRSEGYVFINKKTKTRYHSINKVFDQAVRKARLNVNGTKFRFHDIRHVFANTLIRSNVSMEKVRILLGHEDRSTTDRYITIDRFDVKKELQLIPSIRKNEKEKSLDHKQIKAS
ncbi:tyrosine-type recombinase/integrase [Candidatus Latescibacterota bacterium]